MAAVTDYLVSTTKTSGADLRQHFTAPKFGWPAQLTRYVSTALFVDGRVTLVDKSGIRYEDPRRPEVRAVVGSKDFGSTRVVVAETGPGPEETSAARGLLQDLGQPAKDDSLVTLHDATSSLLQRLGKRLSVVERAKAAGMPLPKALDDLQAAIDDIAAASSRTTTLADDARPGGSHSGQALPSSSRLRSSSRATGWSSSCVLRP